MFARFKAKKSIQKEQTRQIAHSLTVLALRFIERGRAFLNCQFQWKQSKSHRSTSNYLKLLLLSMFKNCFHNCYHVLNLSNQRPQIVSYSSLFQIVASKRTMRHLSGISMKTTVKLRPWESFVRPLFFFSISFNHYFS